MQFANSKFASGCATLHCRSIANYARARFATNATSYAYTVRERATIAIASLINDIRYVHVRKHSRLLNWRHSIRAIRQVMRAQGLRAFAFAGRPAIIALQYCTCIRKVKRVRGSRAFASDRKLALCIRQVMRAQGLGSRAIEIALINRLLLTR